MKLEIIENNPKELKSKKPFLFVPGMYHGAWYYNENFLPYLERNGYKGYALSFSNHGKSESRKNTNLLTIKQYVDDLKEAIQYIGQEPILVGHSMGGFVIQKYLETNKNESNVLLASVAPYGNWRTTLTILKKYPLTFIKTNILLNLKILIQNKKLYLEMMFSNTRTFDEVEENYHKLDNESIGAYLGMSGFNLVKTKKITSNIIVMGGELDKLVIVKEVMDTAKAYDTKPVIFEGVPHDMILDKQWKKIIDTIIEKTMKILTK